ncbi:MAG TPA: phosphotransferase [Actinomycetota bacterium]|nr:phosphotransferase [Actinomycetota bacterium]
MTLWQFYEDRGRPEDEAAFGPLLARVHEALLDYPDPLPPFTIELDDVGRLLEDRPRLSRLREEDHAFWRAVHEEIQSEVSSIRPEDRPLHGSPHSGNWLNAPQGLLLPDFETACRGPVEWDLSAMGNEALDAFGPIDQELLSLLRRMRSLCVAVKCWMDPGRAPEVAEAAVVHLRLLRGDALD